MIESRIHEIVSITRRAWLGGAGAGALVLAEPARSLAVHAASESVDTDDEAGTLETMIDFFGDTTEGLAKVVAKASRKQVRPNGDIRGEEGAAAVTGGVRHGEGELVLKNGPTRHVIGAMARTVRRVSAGSRCRAAVRSARGRALSPSASADAAQPARGS